MLKIKNKYDINVLLVQYSEFLSIKNQIIKSKKLFVLNNLFK